MLSLLKNNIYNSALGGRIIHFNTNEQDPYLGFKCDTDIFQVKYM